MNHNLTAKDASVKGLEDTHDGVKRRSRAPEFETFGGEIPSSEEENLVKKKLFPKVSYSDSGNTSEARQTAVASIQSHSY